MKSHISIYITMFIVMLSVATICEAVKPRSVTTGPNGFVTTEDGVILISQSTKTTFPIIISQPGSYRLSSNLTVPANTNGIEIQADNVTLDLNGLTITGNGSGDGITDKGAFHPNITIRNGTITNFNNGINLSEVFNDVEQIRAINNGNWGISVIGGGSIVSRNIASHNGLSPTTADFGGIITGNDSTISENIVSGNNGIGILASGTISGNHVDHNSINGIGAGINSTISGNTTSNNSGNGISASSGSTISGNTASSNQNFGILTACPSNIVGNTAQFNTNGDLVEIFEGCTLANNNPAP